MDINNQVQQSFFTNFDINALVDIGILIYNSRLILAKKSNAFKLTTIVPRVAKTF